MMAGPLIELPQVHLAAGELVVTREPSVVTTVLGSCVAVTMFDAGSSLAAVCHVMLAKPRGAEADEWGGARRFRYATRALPEMIGAFRRAGARSSAVQVKLFGGANVIGAAHEPDPHWIGGASVAMAHRLLENAGFTVLAENTGGRRGRKILFHTGTGEVLHKFLRAFQR